VRAFASRASMRRRARNYVGDRIACSIAAVQRPRTISTPSSRDGRSHAFRSRWINTGGPSRRVRSTVSILGNGWSATASRSTGRSIQSANTTRSSAMPSMPDAACGRAAMLSRGCIGPALGQTDDRRVARMMRTRIREECKDRRAPKRLFRPSVGHLSGYVPKEARRPSQREALGAANSMLLDEIPPAPAPMLEQDSD
jgi:hypothetical protein